MARNVCVALVVKTMMISASFQRHKNIKRVNLNTTMFTVRKRSKDAGNRLANIKHLCGYSFHHDL